MIKVEQRVKVINAGKQKEREVYHLTTFLFLLGIINIFHQKGKGVWLAM